MKLGKKKHKSSNNSKMCDQKHTLEVSSPGKVILFGEHSVVYGKRAIALSVGLRTSIVANFNNDDYISLNFPAVNLNLTLPLSKLQQLFDSDEQYREHQKEPKPMTAVDQEKYSFLLDGLTSQKEQLLCLSSFLHLYRNIFAFPVPFALKCTSDIPVGGGLGSSASFSVCLSAALLNIANKINGLPLPVNPDFKAISKWAFLCEQIFHGTPSGIDNAVCTYGSGIAFKNGEVTQIAVKPLKVILVNTKVTRSTKTIVANVRKQYDKYQSVIDPILTSMDQLAEAACCALNPTDSSEDQQTLEDLIEMNHSLLRVLGVSHPSLEVIVATAKSFDLAAKLTGAGGGGFAIILAHKGKDVLMDRCQHVLKSHGFETWETELGGMGVDIHWE